MGLAWVPLEALWNSKFERAGFKLQACVVRLWLVPAHSDATHFAQSTFIYSTATPAHFVATPIHSTHCALAFTVTTPKQWSGRWVGGREMFWGKEKAEKKLIISGREDVFLVHPKNGFNSLILN